MQERSFPLLTDKKHPQKRLSELFSEKHPLRMLSFCDRMRPLVQLILLHEVLRVEGAGGVQDSEDHNADVREDGSPHIGDAQRAQQQAGRLDVYKRQG